MAFTPLSLDPPPTHKYSLLHLPDRAVCVRFEARELAKIDQKPGWVFARDLDEVKR
jgi:hypothetical protein